ncbi:hypothetical protein HDV63DRAFT_384143 [Trichoderma sp. SZMC 28014]
MQFSTFTLFSSIAALALAQHDPGEPCKGAKYTCSRDFRNILVCRDNQWALAAACPSDCCTWPDADPAPFCKC